MQLDSGSQDQRVGQVDPALGAELGGARRNGVRDRFDAAESSEPAFNTASPRLARPIREHQGLGEGDGGQRERVPLPDILELPGRTLVVDD
jgi:hypothetical protein